MGIGRDSRHKKRKTGGTQTAYRKKRKYESGRQPAMTKIGPKRVHVVRTRGGNTKFRALRLDSGNFSWGSESVTRKCRILSVVYNPSNNDFVRTNTLVKHSIIEIDATPFRHWYEQNYGIVLGKKNEKQASDKKQSSKVVRKIAKNRSNRILESNVETQFDKGRLLVCVSSRPGQSGRCDGYILEGKELEFYQRKSRKKGAK